MEQNLHKHIKKDAAKWIVVFIAIILILATSTASLVMSIGQTKSEENNAESVESSESVLDVDTYEQIPIAYAMSGATAISSAINSGEEKHAITSDNYGEPLTLLESVLSGEFANPTYTLMFGLQDEVGFKEYGINLTDDLQFIVFRNGACAFGFKEGNDYVGFNYTIEELEAEGQQPKFSICYSDETVHFEFGGYNLADGEIEGDLDAMCARVAEVLPELRFEFALNSLDIDEFFVEESVVYGANVQPLPPAPTKEGYTFTGWYLDEACTQKYNGTTITSDMKLYAGWKINTYTVTFNSDGGSSVASQKVNWNTPVTLSNPTKIGYKFVGWFLANGTQYKNQPIKEDTTLKAKWEINSYTVTFNTDGGNSIAPKAVEYNKSVQTPTPTKEGYNFLGWFMESGKEYTGQAVTSDMTLKAKWEIKKLSVVFNMEGGNAIADKTVNYGQPVTLETPVKEGYNFLGWFLANNTQYTNQAIKANTTLTAKWEIKRFTVTFYVDGAVYNEMTVDYGTRLKDVADRAEVFAQNVVSYRFLSSDLPVGEFGEMLVVDDMEVEANPPTESDKVVGAIKNNWLPIVLGGVGFILLVVVISMVATRKRKRR